MVSIVTVSYSEIHLAHFLLCFSLKTCYNTKIYVACTNNLVFNCPKIIIYCSGPPSLLLPLLSHLLPGLTCQRFSPLLARLSAHTELLLVSKVVAEESSAEDLFILQYTYSIHTSMNMAYAYLCWIGKCVLLYFVLYRL